MKHLETCAERFNAYAPCDCREPAKRPSPRIRALQQHNAALAARVAELEGALADAADALWKQGGSVDSPAYRASERARFLLTKEGR